MSDNTFDVIIEVRIIKERMKSVLLEVELLRSTISDHNERAIERNKALLDCISPLMQEITLLHSRTDKIENVCIERGVIHKEIERFIKDCKEEKKNRGRERGVIVLAMIGWLVAFFQGFIFKVFDNFKHTR